MALSVDAFVQKWKQGWDFRNNIEASLLKGRMEADLEEMMREAGRNGSINGRIDERTRIFNQYGV